MKNETSIDTNASATVNLNTPGNLRHTIVHQPLRVGLRQSVSAEVESGSTAAVEGSSTAPANCAPQATLISVRVGAPGNVRALQLDGSKSWTASEILAQAKLPADGYDLRINGLPSRGDSLVKDGQTLLLLAPVRGN